MFILYPYDHACIPYHIICPFFASLVLQYDAFHLPHAASCRCPHCQKYIFLASIKCCPFLSYPSLSALTETIGVLGLYDGTMGLNGGSGHASGSTLPPSHPLLAELASLRQQLAQYQKSGHQSAIQLQGARLELSLAKEECSVLRETNTTLRSEVDVLRSVYVSVSFPLSCSR